MSRTYEALRKAEEERSREQGTPFWVPQTDSTVEPDSNGRKAPRISLDPGSYIEEEYQKLRGNIFIGPGKTEIKTVLVVGSHHGDGATTTATLLASVLARANRSRVLLIDANLRTPSLAEVFNQTEDPRGLTDLMTDSMPVDELIRPTSLVNLSVITSGRPLPSPSYLFDGDTVERVLKALSDRYDFIIIDGAPVKDYSDSYFLGSKVDGTILVVAAEKTRIDTAQAVKRQLERSGIRLLGAVLNNKKNYIPPVLERFL
jgi:capsular exopolysaccharide synthesis family protein